MTRDDIIRMAREAGMFDGWSLNETMLERFAALVAAHEREACADICEAYDRRLDIPEVRWCAQDIRARGEA